MTTDRLVEWLLMSLPGILLGAYALILQNRKEKNAPLVDRSEAERAGAEADKASAEAEKIRNEITRDVLTATAEERRKMQSEIDSLNRKFNIVISFAREFYSGAVQNAQYIKARNEKPPYDPPSEFPKFPTGPLEAKA